MSPKAKLYADALDLSRRLSLFTALHPVNSQGKVRRGAGPQGGENGMVWSELLRKFIKHTGREVTAEAALVEHKIHTLLDTAFKRRHSLDGPQSSSWPPLIATEDVPAVAVMLSTLEEKIKTGVASELDKNSAKIVLAQGLCQIERFQDSLDHLTAVERVSPTLPEWEAYDLTLRVAANAIEAFANDRLGNPEKAFAACRQALKVYGDTCDIMANSGGSKDDISLHQRGEDINFRLCLWASPPPTSTEQLYFHRQYLRSSRLWNSVCPRPSKFTIIFASYRALLLNSSPDYIASKEWHSEVTALNSAEESQLRKSTSLPPAGEINKPYLKFLDDVAESWRIGGAGREGAAEAVEILYNALTHTFQSQRLLRHLVRVLVANDSHSEAGKALKLYVDIFNKARETDAAQVARDIRKFRVQDPVTTEKESEKSPASPATPEAPLLLDPNEDFDIDSDRLFVETLCFGTRLFCKYLDDPKMGVSLAQRAREVFGEKKDAVLVEDKLVEAKIEMALGIALGTLSAQESDWEPRPDQHTLILKHLERAHTLNPTSWEILYHLAYHLAEQRQITSALEKAREAVQLNRTSRDCWHLLGLLVSAQKDLAASLEVLETALDDEEVNDAATVEPTDLSAPVIDVFQLGLGPLPPRPTVAPRSFWTNNYDFPRDEVELLASETQLRMTTNVVIEALEGPEAALLDQQSLLAYFSQAFGSIKESEQAKSKPLPDPLLVETTPSPRRSSVLHRSKYPTASEATTTLKSTTPGQLNGTVATRSTSTSFVLVTPDASRVELPLRSSEDPSQSTASNAGSIPTIDTSPRATKLLLELWLMSAASFRRAGKVEECRGAIQEAETLDADHPDVWVQFALYCLATSSLESAKTSLIKALTFSPSHLRASVLLARLYLVSPPPASSPNSSRLPFAEGLLEALTKTNGWNSPEAWFELSRCYKLTERKEREKDALVWALGLEESRGVRPLQEALNRVL